MNEADEIMNTVDQLQNVLEDLMVRGLRSAGTKELNVLQALAGEFERIGAHHLAGRIGTLHHALAGQDRSAAAALLKAQASLRLFERVLTLEVTRGQMTCLIPQEEEADESE